MRSKKRDYDLTSGPILGRLLLVAVPVMGTQLMQMFYNLTDMFWLGQLGPDAVAASGSAGLYLWLASSLALFGRIGAEIGVSQKLGQHQPDAAGRYAQNALQLSVVLGLVFSALMLVLRVPLISFFNIQDATVAHEAAVYLGITAFGNTATYISAAIGGIYTASGNSRTPFFINGVGLLVNVVLDPVLIHTYNLGIQGAAIATTFAQLLVCVLFLWAGLRGKSRPFPKLRLFATPSLAAMRTILRWGVPVVVESLLFAALSMVISRFVAAFGTDAMAVQRVGGQIESLSWLVGGGFASAVTAFIGQNYGAGKWRRVRRGFSLSLGAMLVWGVVCTLLLYFAGGAIFSLFLHEQALIEMGRGYLRILAACQVVACLEYVSAGMFRGIGKTLPPSIGSVGGNLLRIPIVYYLSRTALGLDGIWWGITIGAILRSLLVFGWFVLASRRLPREDSTPGAL